MNYQRVAEISYIFGKLNQKVDDLCDYINQINSEFSEDLVHSISKCYDEINSNPYANDNLKALALEAYNHAKSLK